MDKIKHPGGPSGPDPRHRHETSGINIKYIIYFAVALVGGSAAALLITVGMFSFFEEGWKARDVLPSPLAEGSRLPPEPRLQVSPSRDILTLRASDEAALNSYGWVSRDQQIVRIPVDRAIDIIVERGSLPTRPGDWSYETAAARNSVGESGFAPGQGERPLESQDNVPAPQGGGATPEGAPDKEQ